MNVFALSWKNLRHRPAVAVLNLLLFALGIGLISLVLQLSRQVYSRFEANLADIHMVIGAKGSPLQLVLSSMYHLDNPTGNIPLEKAKAFLRPGHPLIELAAPLSLGDSHEGYRIVGTTDDLLTFYGASVAEGTLFAEPMDITAGAEVATALGLQLGDTFSSSHGFDHNDDLLHADAPPFRVTGILTPSGTVLDQLLLTPPQSVWVVHGSGPSTTGIENSGAQEPEHQHNEAHEHEGHEHDGHEHVSTQTENVNSQGTGPQIPAYRREALLDAPDGDITAVLVRFKNKTNFRALNMPRQINENTDLMATAPAVQLNQLYDQLGVGTEVVQWVLGLLVVVSLLSIFLSLYASLRHRRAELALMRVMGASQAKLFGLVILEGWWIALLGFVLGILLSHGFLWLLANNVAAADRYGFTAWSWLPEETYLLVGSLFLGLVAALLPAWEASRTEIAKAL